MASRLVESGWSSANRECAKHRAYPSSVFVQLRPECARHLPPTARALTRPAIVQTIARDRWIPTRHELGVVEIDKTARPHRSRVPTGGPRSRPSAYPALQSAGTVNENRILESTWLGSSTPSLGRVSGTKSTQSKQPTPLSNQKRGLLLPKRAAALWEGTQWCKGGTGKAEAAKLPDAGISLKQCPGK